MIVKINSFVLNIVRKYSRKYESTFEGKSLLRVHVYTCTTYYTVVVCFRKAKTFAGRASYPLLYTVHVHVQYTYSNNKTQVDKHIQYEGIFFSRSLFAAAICDFRHQIHAFARRTEDEKTALGEART